jgi:alpha-D-xyloside xylohydrolase
VCGYCHIPLQWNEAAGKLAIGSRHGKFPGLVKDQTFRIVFVGEGHGNGVAEIATADQVVKFTGKTVTVKARQ